MTCPHRLVVCCCTSTQHREAKGHFVVHCSMSARTEGDSSVASLCGSGSELHGASTGRKGGVKACGLGYLCSISVAYALWQGGSVGGVPG